VRIVAVSRVFSDISTEILKNNAKCLIESDQQKDEINCHLQIVK
jgi:hypothetical protein